MIKVTNNVLETPRQKQNHFHRATGMKRGKNCASRCLKFETKGMRFNQLQQ